MIAELSEFHYAAQRQEERCQNVSQEKDPVNKSGERPKRRGSKGKVGTSSVTWSCLTK